MEVSKEISALLFEAHKNIDRIANDVVGALLHKERRADISYPPGGHLTDEEQEALHQLGLSEGASVGLKKIIADACASILFSTFCVIDGVGDPSVWEDEDWPGLQLSVPATDEDRAFLHDEFFDSYWQYLSWKDNAIDS